MTPENSASIEQLRILRPQSPSGFSHSATQEQPYSGMLLRSNSGVLGARNSKSGPVLNSLISHFGNIMWSKDQFKKSRTHKIKVKEKDETSLFRDYSKTNEKPKRETSNIIHNEYFVKKAPVDRPGSALPSQRANSLISSHHNLFRKRPSSSYLMARYQNSQKSPNP